MTITAYPLCWPPMRPRSKQREWGRFKSYRQRISVASASGRLQNELDKLGARDAILSTNVKLRLDGWPRSDQATPQDPGVAVYFTLRGEPHCLPCDRYDEVGQNIAAIAAHIEATRAIERYGVATVKEMFTGFKALPDPNRPHNWRDILGFASDKTPTHEEIERHFRSLAQVHHPDKGGDSARFSEISAAREEGLRSTA